MGLNKQYVCSTGQQGNSFVGIKVKGNDVYIYYPEAYKIDTENPNDDLLELLKSISLAKTHIETGSERMFDAHISGGDFAILSYVRLIEDYMRNGTYFDTEITYRSNVNGKISWKRTLDGQPLISNGNVVYKNIIVEVKSPVESTLVECYYYCLRKSLNLMGWMFGLTADMISLPIYSKEFEPQYLRAVMTELDRTFDDRKATRLMHMKNVLTGLDEVQAEEQIVYGVDAYDYVFERMVDRVFGTVSENDIKDYYPSVKWHFCLNNTKSSERHIRPDTIMRKNDDIVVIDSKYYRYGSLELTKNEGLPDIASIQKQVAYGSYVHHKHSGCNVYNAFILPYDSNGANARKHNLVGNALSHTGYAQVNWHNNSFGCIYVFLIDLKYLVHNWYRSKNEQLSDNMLNTIKSFS